jgi:hypothetical protein
MTRKPKPVIGTSAAVLMLSLHAWLGCGESDEPLLSGRGFGGAPSYAASTAISSNASTAVSTGSLTWPDPVMGPHTDCAPNPSPLEVPYGWIEYIDWSCKCRFYVPGSKDALPEPIQWKPCTSPPQDVDCKVMDVSWSDTQARVALGHVGFARNRDGSAVLGFRRITGRRRLDLVADADGAVRSAIMQIVPPSYDPSCYLLTDSVNEGKVLYNVQGDNMAEETPSNIEGAIGGSFDDFKPTLIARGKNRYAYSNSEWAVGAKWIARISGSYKFHVYARSWKDPSNEIFITSPEVDPEWGDPSQLLVRGDAVFWNTTSSIHRGINIWTEEGGVRPFIRWVGDDSKGAGSLGTDGVDMVWAYGEGKSPHDDLYPQSSVMTSPFMTDPEKLKPRRLRKYPDATLGEKGFVVGCGYAAYEYEDPEQDGRATMVIRLSDGVAWIVTLAPQFTFLQPLGLTCEEVFIQGYSYSPYEVNIARVRIDSLGPGLPPD